MKRWEAVWGGEPGPYDPGYVRRLRVPGGWLYQMVHDPLRGPLTFVPDPSEPAPPYTGLRLLSPMQAKLAYKLCMSATSGHRVEDSMVYPYTEDVASLLRQLGEAATEPP